MTGCETVTDVGLAWMSSGCPALERLDIVGCIQVGRGVGVSCSIGRLLLDAVSYLSGSSVWFRLVSSLFP